MELKDELYARQLQEIEDGKIARSINALHDAYTYRKQTGDVPRTARMITAEQCEEQLSLLGTQYKLHEKCEAKKETKKIEKETKKDDKKIEKKCYSCQVEVVSNSSLYCRDCIDKYEKSRNVLKWG